MNTLIGVFPFGARLQEIAQKPGGPEKRAFFVGVYSSAVHARWIGPDEAVKVAALAVGIEPYIFWKGENAAEHIPTIHERFGRLEPAGSGNNGPSGRALDSHYLEPLALNRDQVWLSDLIPHALSNAEQQSAIKRHYALLQTQFGLPQASIPLEPANAAEWIARVSANRLMEELTQSRADTIVTLGNDPIRYFLNRVCPISFPLLSREDYGSPRQAIIGQRTYRVFCLAHMRVTVIRPLPNWKQIHDEWIAGNLGL